MKRKLWAALLTAALVTVLPSTAVAAEEWGFGGWEVAKRQADWNPDGVWAEGEYYSVDDAYKTENCYAANGELRERAENLDYMMAMSWDEQYLYTYISYQAPTEPIVSADLWDGYAIQFSGTDVGNVTVYEEGKQNPTEDPRFEIGIAKDFETNTEISNNWCTWLNSDYGFDSNCTDDFEVFYCDGWVTYEFRVPFAAFTTVIPAEFTEETAPEDRQVGVTYVITIGDGNWNYSHVQIGRGITGGKAAESHACITLTDTPDIAPDFPEEVYQYGILFHNIGNTNPRSDYRNIYFDAANGYQNYDEGTAYAEDLLGIIASNPDQLKALTAVSGYDFVCFRPVYWNYADDVFTVVETKSYTLEDMVSLTDAEVLQYAWYDDEHTWCIMFTACYDPQMYTVKFNNIGNVDNWDNTNYYTAQKEDTVPYGTNFYDIFPYEEEYPELFNVPGHYLTAGVCWTLTIMWKNPDTKDSIGAADT